MLEKKRYGSTSSYTFIFKRTKLVYRIGPAVIFVFETRQVKRCGIHTLRKIPRQLESLKNMWPQSILTVQTNRKKTLKRKKQQKKIKKKNGQTQIL